MLLAASYDTKDSGTCCGAERYQWQVPGKQKSDCQLEPTKSQCEELAEEVDGAGTTVTEMNGDWQTGTCFKEGGSWSYNTANTPSVCTSDKVCYCLSNGNNNITFYIISPIQVRRYYTN